LILDGKRPALDALTETLLFYAARANHLAELIRPALAKGDVVLCDRFSDSTRVYQGVLGAVPSVVVEQLEALVVAETKPDVTIILDIPPETGLARASTRRGSHQADRFESETLEFHKNLRQGFLDLAERDSDRIIVIPALGNEVSIENEIWQKLASRFPLFQGRRA
jgi:dTMP kinase